VVEVVASEARSEPQASVVEVRSPAVVEVVASEARSEPQASVARAGAASAPASR
jgi:hypothetical protein